MTKRYLIIEVDEDYKIGQCDTCIIENNYPHCNIPHWADCPLANAKEAVEVKTFKTSQGHAYTGRATTVYAIKTEEKL